MKTRFSTIDLMAALHEVRGFTGLRVSNVSTFCFICLYCNFYHFYLFGILKFEIFQPYFLTNTLNYCSSKIKKIQIYDFSSLRGCRFWVIFILKTILISDLRFQSEGILDPTAKAGNQSDHSLGIGPASSPDRAKLGQVAISLFVLDEAQETRQGLTVDFVFNISHFLSSSFTGCRQIGVDRIVDLQFGEDERAVHVILELYDRYLKILFCLKLFLYFQRKHPSLRSRIRDSEYFATENWQGQWCQAAS